MNIKFSRGSEWRKWDLHIHTPASFHWEGQQFNSDPCSPNNASLVDEMIRALNAAEPAVFAIMDYWTFDGWFALKHRLSQPDSPTLEKTVFPGIELRLMAPMNGRLNAHVLFSDNIDDQELIDFKSNLKLEFPGKDPRNLSNNALIDYARFVSAEKLTHHGLISDNLNNNEDALKAGSIMAELNCESYKKAIAKVKNNQAIGFIPFDTSDGLTSINRNEHYAYVLGLFKSSPIFETRKIDLWEAFSGIKNEKNKSWINEFQTALNNTPRLAVSGSDAHRFIGEIGNNDKRGYGDYPSGKATWIKANPTFEGLQQAIKEPAKRSFIGEQPLKKKLLNDNKSLFIDKLKIYKRNNSTLPDQWLDRTELDLNPDLIAIIGNKGSGKSALADIVALLGNSKQSHHFSFLKENRFRGKTGEPAKHFSAQLTWADGQILEKDLNENPATENVEFVKYIPQGHFEGLCNAHVSGHSDTFEKELRSVIFSHADDTIRLGAFDFEQLIEQQERLLRSRFIGLRGELHTINYQIESIENQMLPNTRKEIEELIIQKQRLFDEHNKIKPEEIAQPTGVLSEEQQQASKDLIEIATELEKIKTKKQENQEELTKLSAKKKSSRNIKDGIDVIKRSIQQFITDFNEDIQSLGLESNALIEFNINEQPITLIDNTILSREEDIKKESQEINDLEQSLIERRVPLNNQLNGPQQAHQQYMERLKDWEEQKTKLLGTYDQPDSLCGLKYRKKQLELLPEQRTHLQTARLDITAQIYDLLNEQKFSRETLFQPVQQLIQDNRLIRDEYKLQFIAQLNSTTEQIYGKLFALVKQLSGEFRVSA